MRAYPPIPEAGEQTSIRDVIGFWMTDLVRSALVEPGSDGVGTSIPATWLVRNAVTTDWRGITVHAKTGENPIVQAAYATKQILGVMPGRIDVIGVAQPDEMPWVKRTTFIMGLGGAALPKPIVSIEAGLFPLDDLPFGHMDPEQIRWMTETLQTAYREGLSPMHTTVEPARVA